MRQPLRFLPAFLALLVPLGALAFLGSRELSRQQDLAETFLRERAFDFLSSAGRRLDSEFAALTEFTLGHTLDTDFPNLTAAARAHRSANPEIAELFVLDGDGDLVHPHRGPTIHSVLHQRTLDVRIAQTLLARDDQKGALEFLESTDTASGHAAHSGTKVQLAGLHRRLHQEEKALEIFEGILASLPASGQVREARSARALRIGFEHETTRLLGRTGEAELHLELKGDSEPLLRLLREIADGEFSYNSDDVLHAVVDRATDRLPFSAEGLEALSAARTELAELLASRQRALDYEAMVELPLREPTQRHDQPHRYHVYDPGLTTNMLILREVQAEERSLYAGEWVGFQLDLTAFVNRVLEVQLAPGDDGFQLDIVTPQGNRVLRQPLPEGAEEWKGELHSRASIAGLQLQAIPHNAAQQLESRRSSDRNRAFLVLALCLVAGGGAFFLVRSVGREAELAAMKVDLVSRVSHELKTPLSMIKMYGETLGMGRTKNEQQASQFAAIISREADRLTTWIDRILDFSRHESGEITYHKEQTDISDLVGQVTEAYRPHLEAANVRLITNLEENLHAEVDPGMLESAVVNLLENAVKFTRPSESERPVELTLKRDADLAVLEVRDRGVGIPPRETDRIFDSFYRASTAGEVRGAGLGLSLVQHFARAHDGTVQATPRERGGTTFRLSLPLFQANGSNHE